MSVWPSPEPCIESSVCPWGLPVPDFTHALAHTNTHMQCTYKNKKQALVQMIWQAHFQALSLSCSVCVSLSLPFYWIRASSVQLLIFFLSLSVCKCLSCSLITQGAAHLGRLGRGEVKPGRDKVMLRHLGPVFPVSGSRHQTSWPGSERGHMDNEGHIPSWPNMTFQHF